MYFLYYHNVIDRPLGPLDECRDEVGRFRLQMEFLKENFEMVTLDEAMRRMEAGEECSRCATVTFDDGYAGVGKNAAPVMRELSIPGTVFAITSAGLLHYEESNLAFRATSLQSADLSCFGLGKVELATEGQRADAMEEVKGQLNLAPGATRAALHASLLEALHVSPEQLAAEASKIDPDGVRMTDEELRSLQSAGWTVGAHTRTHRRLSQLSREDLIDEVAGCRQDLRRILGQAPDYLAYPYGREVDFSDMVIEEVRNAGYRAAFSTTVGAAQPGDPPYSLKRMRFSQMAKRLGRELAPRAYALR